MRQWIRRNIDKFAAAVSVMVIAGASFGAVSNTGPVARMPERQSQTNSKRTEKTAMLTETKQDNKIHRADQENFADLVLNSDVPVLVDFYADWCGPCRMIAPVLDELARETTGAKIVKVNVDQSPELAARYGVKSIPNLKVFDDGKVVDEQVGLANKARLKAMLDI
jgi:thioredoxin 1